MTLLEIVYQLALVMIELDLNGMIAQLLERLTHGE